MADYQILGIVMALLGVGVFVFAAGVAVGKAGERVRYLWVIAERDELREQLALRRQARTDAFAERCYQFADANVAQLERHDQVLWRGGRGGAA